MEWTSRTNGKSSWKMFSSEYKTNTKNGTIKCMKDIDLGDILEDGSIVESVLKIDNKQNQIPFLFHS